MPHATADKGVTIPRSLSSRPSMSIRSRASADEKDLFALRRFAKALVAWNSSRLGDDHNAR